MQRILIADSVEMFADRLGNLLAAENCVEVCNDGSKLLRTFNEFCPDILVIDMAIPHCDTLAFLHSIVMSGSNTRIVVLSYIISDDLQMFLGKLGVVHLFRKPCTVESVFAFIKNLIVLSSEDLEWSENTELDNILLHLGFQCGRSRYQCIYNAILLRYHNKGGDSAKYLYIEVSRLFGKNSPQGVEKAIRDAIHHAWENGDCELWKLYFPQCDKMGCPANECFVDRITRALTNREKIRKPFKEKVCS